MNLYFLSTNFSDSKAEAVAYISNARPTLPAVYNSKKSEGRTAQQSQLLSREEYNKALGSGYTAMNHRFVIKTEKFCDEISELRKRIVDYNVGNAANLGDEGLDDSDIEHLQAEIDDDNDSEVEFELLFPKPSVVVVKLECNNEDDSENAHQNESPNGSLTDGDVLTQSHVSETADGDVRTQLHVLQSGSVENNVNEQQTGDVLIGPLNYEQNDANDLFFPDFDTTIRAPIVTVLRAWNSTSPFNLYLYDKKFVGVLLREIMATRKQNAEDGMDEQGMVFIKRLFEIRVQSDEVRLSNFDALFKEKANNIRRRASHIDT